MLGSELGTEDGDSVSVGERLGTELGSALLVGVKLGNTEGPSDGPLGNELG